MQGENLIQKANWADSIAMMNSQGHTHFRVLHANKNHSSGSRELEHVGRTQPYNCRLDKSIKLAGREERTQRKMDKRIKQNTDLAKIY